MPKSENKKASLKNISKIQLFMILGYAVIVAAAVWAVSRLAITKTDETLKNKVISLTSSLNMQMKLNLESYLSRMETIGTLAFGEEKAAAVFQMLYARDDSVIPAAFLQIPPEVCVFADPDAAKKL